MVVLLGVGHSGTTIVYRVLALHPDLTWFSQYSLRTGEIPGRRRLLFARPLERTLRRLLLHDWRKRQRGTRRIVAPVPSEGYLIWRYLLPKGDAGVPTEAARRVRAAVLAQCAAAHRRVLLVKLARLAYHREVLAAAVPDCTFIHVIRDGRAVAASVGRKRSARRARPDADPLLAAAEQWRDEIAVIADPRAAGTRIDVRYEDFCDDVHGTVAAILQAAGLDPSGFPFHRVPARLASTNPARLERLAPGVLAAIEAIQRPWLERFRYV